MKNATLADYKERMLRVLLHIQQNLDEPLELDELAAVACFSPYHFHRIFSGMVGESVKEYVRRVRLERAAQSLKLGKASVVEIALAAGYETHEAFTRSFKAMLGVTPSEYRRTHRTSGPEDGALDFRPRRGGRMKVEIKTVTPMRVAFLRHVGPYNEVGEAWDRLTMLLGKEGHLGGECMMLGVCYDDPEVTPPAKIRYDACVTVDASFAPFDEVGVQIVAGGEYAVLTHVGPYSGLGKAYTELLGKWLPRSGRELRNVPCFEVYVNDPGSTAPADLITDIYAPLQPAQE